MAKKIIWSPRAIDTYEKVIRFLEQHWTEKEVEKFIQATIKTLRLISSDGVQFRRSKKRNIFEVLVTKHNLLLYRVTQQRIELLTFFDTRQNPTKKFPKKRRL